MSETEPRESRDTRRQPHWWEHVIDWAVAEKRVKPSDASVHTRCGA